MPRFGEVFRPETPILPPIPKWIPGRVIPVESPILPSAPRSILGRVMRAASPSSPSAPPQGKITLLDSEYFMAHHPARMARSIRAWAE